MLSSLGFDPKNASRAARTNSNSKYLLEVPRGFSVHVFKNPPPSGYTPSGKPDTTNHSRVPPNSGWAPPPGYPSRADGQRKHSFSVPHDVRNASAVFAHPFEPQRTKSSRPYGIFPSGIPDTYIYEPSVASDILSRSESSSSSDSDLTESVVSLSIEVSSTRASSSTETLNSTLEPVVPERRIDVKSQRSSPPTTGPISARPSTSTDLTRTRSQSPTSGRKSSPTSRSSPPSVPRRATVETVSDDDSDTVVSEGGQVERLVPDNSGNRIPLSISATIPGTSPPIPAPIATRSPDERLPAHPRVREAIAISRGNSRHASTSPIEYREFSGSPPYGDPPLRTPPGLVGVSETTPAGGPTRRSPPHQHSAPVHVGIASETIVVGGTRRCVRWTENLVCPSPLPRTQRRKGWFNRRGDQLWTNDGKYMSPEAGHEYPPDLSGYPEPSAGWMNEEGTRIDMEHRLIPKAPLRSALKRPTVSTQFPDTFHPTIITPIRT